MYTTVLNQALHILLNEIILLHGQIISFRSLFLRFSFFFIFFLDISFLQYLLSVFMISYRFDPGEGTVQPSQCPAGHYCPPGLSLGLEFPCPPGTVQSQLGASSPEACLPCPAGMWSLIQYKKNNCVTSSLSPINGVSCRNVLLSAWSVPANGTLRGWFLLSCWIDQPQLYWVSGAIFPLSAAALLPGGQSVINQMSLFSENDSWAYWWPRDLSFNTEPHLTECTHSSFPSCLSAQHH